MITTSDSFHWMRNNEVNEIPFPTQVLFLSSISTCWHRLGDALNTTRQAFKKNIPVI